jgi:hypothetical protein
MKFSLFISTLAIIAMFSTQALACGGCGCEKGEGDDDDDGANVYLSHSSQLMNLCGEGTPDDGDGDVGLAQSSRLSTCGCPESDEGDEES